MSGKHQGETTTFSHLPQLRDYNTVMSLKLHS